MIACPSGNSTGLSSDRRYGAVRVKVPTSHLQVYKYRAIPIVCLQHRPVLITCRSIIIIPLFNLSLRILNPRHHSWIHWHLQQPNGKIKEYQEGSLCAVMVHGKVRIYTPFAQAGLRGLEKTNVLTKISCVQMVLRRKNDGSVQTSLRYENFVSFECQVHLSISHKLARMIKHEDDRYPK